MILKDGHTFEKAAIQKWFEMGNTTNPLTNKAIGKEMIPNLALRNLIRTHKELAAAGESTQVFNKSFIFEAANSDVKKCYP